MHAACMSASMCAALETDKGVEMRASLVTLYQRQLATQLAFSARKSNET